jgi:hypothetical protein
VNPRSKEVVTLWPQWSPFLERVGNNYELLYGLFLSFRDRMAKKSTVLRPARPVFDRSYRLRQLLWRRVPLF